MAEAVITMDGWFALHDTRHFDWTSWKLVSEEERQAAVDEFKQLIDKWEPAEEEKKGTQGLYKVVGNKADLMFVFLRPTTEELEEIKNYLLGKDHSIEDYHREWARQLKDKYGTISDSNEAEQILEKELEMKFARVLQDAGVMKDQNTCKRFIQTLNA